MEIRRRGNVSDEVFEKCRVELESHESLQDLLRWAERRPAGTLVPGAIAELVIQDEFTHDLVVPWQGVFLVYGTT